ncbi:MAG: RNA 3'-terminal phosphate cyclase [Spirochaetota bacterium]|nr:RNA 3'-terminal phosphate cyclase [Spirochaetota bacterium]
MIELRLPGLDRVAARQAISLSLATGKSFRLSGGFGLARQDPAFAACLSDWENALASLSAGSFLADGEDLLFRPGTLRHGTYTLQTGPFSSALELVLLMLPPLTRLDYRTVLSVRGVTHSDLSYTTDFVNLTLFDILERMGFYLHLSLRRFGFYGSGGGLIEARAYPGEAGGTMPGLVFRDVIMRGARVYIARLPTDIALMQRGTLSGLCGLPESSIGIVEVLDADGPGNCVQAYAECDGRSMVLQAVSPVYDADGEYIFNEERAEETARSLASLCARLKENGAPPPEAAREILPYSALSGSPLPAGAGETAKLLADAFG